MTTRERLAAGLFLLGSLALVAAAAAYAGWRGVLAAAGGLMLGGGVLLGLGDDDRGGELPPGGLS